MEKSSIYGFGELIHELFKNLKFKAIPEAELKNQLRVDFLLEETERKVLVEVKGYRTNRIDIFSLNNALTRLKSYSTDEDFGGLLVISTFLNRKIASKIKEEEGVEIWDRNMLFYLTKDFPDLRAKLEKILLTWQQPGTEDIYQGMEQIRSYDPQSIFSIRIKHITEPITKGKEICKELISIDSGWYKSKSFEDLCQEAVKYLFEGDMAFWQSQVTTHDQLHRFDLIARIASLHDFWRSLARDFHSRYVVFEFKNYADPITQKEVYSTEKYLFTTALRSIAIIISRKGSDKHAKVAMQGSLRESGKLIFGLDLDDLCEMLSMKDDGDDPNTYLSDKLDGILMLMSR